MFLNFYHLSGSIKYRGWIPRRKLPKNLQRLALKSGNFKLYDVGNLSLSFFNECYAREYDLKGDLWDHGIVENGQFKRNRKTLEKDNDSVSSSPNSIDFIPFSTVNNYEAMEGNPPFRIDENIFQGYFPPVENSPTVIQQTYREVDSDDSSSLSTYDESDIFSEQDESTFNIGNIYDHIYEGDEYLGLPNGKGILYDIELDNPLYVGHFLNGSFHRNGIAYENGKKVYNGEWRNGKRHGYGKSYNEGNRLLFEGIWKNDFPYFGSIYLNNEKILYHGLFQNYEGFFLLHQDFLEEKTYKGFWKNGKKDGFGILTKYGQTHFEGNWKNGKIHGSGKLYNNGKLVFKGEFKENLRHGMGTMFKSNGEMVYEGQWKNDKKNGYGHEHLGYEIYKGEWKDNKRDGYGIEWLISHDGDDFYKSFSGLWKNNEKWGQGIDFFESGGIMYEGCYDETETGFGREYYDTGHLKYEGEYDNGRFHGSGRLFYINQTLCFEGNFQNGYFYSGTFYDKDGSVHKSSFVDGDSYCYGVTLSLNDESIAYRGHFKNGKFHGKGTSFADDKEQEPFYDGYYKDGKPHGQGTYYREDRTAISGTFLNGFFYDEENQCLKNLWFDKKGDCIIYKGTIKDEKYYNGVEYIFEDTTSSYRYCQEPIGSIVWKDGAVFDENAERERLRKELNILNYLETKNKKKLEKIYKKDYLDFLKNKYNVDEQLSEKMTKKQLLNEIERKRRGILSVTETPAEAEFDLFGNEIVNPVVGFDGETYDESSMKYLFERDEENNFVNIQYNYDENHQRQPSYPIMSNGKKLDGYTKGKIKICEYPSIRMEYLESDGFIHLPQVIARTSSKPYL